MDGSRKLRTVSAEARYDGHARQEAKLSSSVPGGANNGYVLIEPAEYRNEILSNNNHPSWYQMYNSVKKQRIGATFIPNIKGNAHMSKFDLIYSFKSHKAENTADACQQHKLNFLKIKSSLKSYPKLLISPHNSKLF